MAAVQQANKAIVLTPAGGAAAIAVVRLAGPGVRALFDRHFTGKPKVGRAVHGMLQDDAGESIDDPVVVLVDEQTADLNLHGGPWIVRRTLELCELAGFDVVDPQQSFPLISESVDGDTPLQREVLAHLPRATTDLGVRLLLAQPRAWRDLTEQADRGADVSDCLVASVRDRTLEHLLSPPRVAIVGAANVGKSTLANALFVQERSITADVAGTTRDWVGELANIDGLPVMLVDTPGLRDTDDPIERLAIERSGGEIGKADLVVLVLDAARPIGEQAPLLDRFDDAIVVVNKSDVAVPAWDPSSMGIDGIRTVATRGTGIAELRRRILRHFGISTSPADPRIWTARQRNLVERGITDPAVLRHL